MKKKVILISLLVIIIAACFIPVTQQKTITINTPLLTVYRQLSSPQNWEKWRPELRKAFIADSGKILIQKDTASFRIKYADQELNVRPNENSFVINDTRPDKTLNYTYTIIPDKLQTTVLDKSPKKTFVTVSKKVSFINYLAGKIRPAAFSDTYIDDFKRYMETDSLFYGYNIFKTRVPESNLIEIKKAVLAKDRFIAAAGMLTTLQQYLKTHHVEQLQPLIAQFLPKGKDSTQINIGLFIDKEVKSDNEVKFTRMPKGGPLYAIKFNGKFNERQKAYNSLHQYFTDHLYQSAIFPFETYLDNKLPGSDTDKVNIQVNFSAYF